ncbi:hypothetical protein KTF56_28930 [Burkholderia gladioli]|uniref:hypothetical protein n=1 Tax=Burkholderia gladioli TaxID=28095 RepID=UPI001C21A665|nr:hypothetical protein [Burkholderia gladioli]MBU9686921.1 hypothetical protein [Burkholderia gladioli]
MKRILLTIALLASSPGFASGSPDVAVYRAYLANPNTRLHDVFEGYTNGVVHGLMMANFSLENAHSTRLFCPPSKLPMNAGIAFNLVEPYIAKTKAPDNIPFAGVVLLAFQDAFPCNK